MKNQEKIFRSLKFVDAIIVFSGTNTKNLIQTIKPDILVKGGDYKISNKLGMI